MGPAGFRLRLCFSGSLALLRELWFCGRWFSFLLGLGRLRSGARLGRLAGYHLPAVGAFDPDVEDV